MPPLFPAALVLPLSTCFGDGYRLASSLSIPSALITVPLRLRLLVAGQGPATFGQRLPGPFPRRASTGLAAPLATGGTGSLGSVGWGTHPDHRRYSIVRRRYAARPQTVNRRRCSRRSGRIANLRRMRPTAPRRYQRYTAGVGLPGRARSSAMISNVRFTAAA